MNTQLLFIIHWISLLQKDVYKEIVYLKKTVMDLQPVRGVPHPSNYCWIRKEEVGKR